MSRMDSLLRMIRSRRIGVAFSGGSVRGLAHIGVIKGLSEYGISSAIVAGTSAGSLIGAALAAGLDWRQLASLACSVFWPGLLHAKTLEAFCKRNLPETFAQLHLPFAAVGTALPSKKPVVITQGKLAPALSASCAMRILRRPVVHQGRRLKDGGIACVLPAPICRQLGADFVIASDVWELSSVLRRIGVLPTLPLGRRFYPPFRSPDSTEHTGSGDSAEYSLRRTYDRSRRGGYSQRAGSFIQGWESAVGGAE
jgi:NTE family protein